MKKIFLTIILSTCCIVFLASSVCAVTIDNPLGTKTFEGLVDAITGFIFTIALALAPVMLIISGFMFVTSAGDVGRVGTAKKLALYTIVGLAIILLASGLIKVLQSILGVTTT